MRRRWVVGVLVALATVLLVGRFASAAYVDYLWYSSLRATSLWRLQFQNAAIVGVGSMTIASLFLFLNLYTVRQSVVSLQLPRRLANLEIAEEVPGKYLTRLAAAVSLVLGVFLALPRHRWLEFAAFRYSVPFAERDPFIDHDLSYFVNWLPFEKALFAWCLVLLTVTLVTVVFLYALTPSLRWEKGEGLHVTLYVRRHVGILFAIALLVLAWSFRLQMLDSFFGGTGVDGAFTLVDRQMLSARTMLTVLTMLAAFLLAWAMWTDQMRLAFFCVTCVLLVSLGTNGLAPILLGGSNSQADEITTARQDNEHRAARTRRAFAVDEIIPAEPASTFSFASAAEAVNGVPAWDPPEYELAASRGEATVSGNATYLCSGSGQVIQVVVSESEPPDPAAARSWRLVRSYSGTTIPEGGPRNLAQDEPGEPLYTILISEPGSAMFMVADSANRIAAPALEEPLSRLAHAWSRQDFRMMLTELPRPNPRIIVHGSIRDRLRKLAPFFRQDSRIVPAVQGDTLFWIVRLYSHSRTYPLSHPVTIGDSTFSYFQFAATASINAATGSVRIYMNERIDPVARIWARALPDYFASIRELPAALSASLPPAVDGARAQAVAFASFGRQQGIQTNGRVADGFAGEAALRRMSQALVSFPAICPGPAWLQPVLDSNDRLESMIIAVGGSDPETYRMSLANGAASWQEIQRRFDQVEDSVRQHREGNVSSGPLRAVPVAGEIVLLRTTYERILNEPPTIAAVTLLRGDSLRTTASLSLSAQVDASRAPGGPLTPEQFRARTDSLYQGMRAALRRGDMIAFGELFNALGALLGRNPR